MASPTTTLRLRPELREQITRLARRHRRSFSEVVQNLLDEALRLRSCAGIYFSDEPTGRVAKVVGTGLAVWEIVRDYLECGNDRTALRKLFPRLSMGQIQASLLYYSRYPDEIDEAIAENRGLTWQAVEDRLGSLVKRG
ncbi:MAG: hypothetical protein HY815_25755 [Candidatus Riflebacteria bacterium]|nr:hypothetical protein [Candidatus Riflebacteria bacterium]